MQRSIKAFIEISAIVGALTAAVAASWQAYIARDTERRQLRAYIYPVFFEVPLFSSSTASRISVRIVLINHGQTPATKVHGRSTLRIAPFPLPGNYSPDFDTTINQIFTIFPETEISITSTSHWLSTSATLTPSQISDFLNIESKNRLYIFEEIIYDDVFGDSHRTRRCSYLEPSATQRKENGDISVISWARCDRFDDID